MIDQEEKQALDDLGKQLLKSIPALPGEVIQELAIPLKQFVNERLSDMAHEQSMEDLAESGGIVGAP